VQTLRDQQNREIASKADIASRLKEVDFGRYYAVVIGNNEYKEWPKLKTAVADARSVAEVLEKKYGFRVKLLTNAGRAQILGAVEEFADEVGPRDNLLVYYAGHGIIEQGAGYWVPVDADAYTTGKTLKTQNLVKNEELMARIQKLQAKQVMVIADSCFSGGLATAVAPPVEPQQLALAEARLRGPAGPRGGIRIVETEDNVPVAALQGTVVKADVPEELIAMGHWASKMARVVLTSGGNEPVIDQLKASDQHSIFTLALLEALKRNRGMMKSIDLTTAVQDRVISGIGKAARSAGKGTTVAQTPSSNNILGYNGEFLFVARN
jgi:uncharacterized caspase-like protein